MRRIAEALWAVAALTIIEAAVAMADSADKYSDYYAGRQAYNQGDCAGAVRHLTAFLEDNPYIRERYLSFYLDIQQAIGDCTGGGHVSGIGNESKEPDLLPDHTPMEK
jgi:hypothetical protein